MALSCPEPDNYAAIAKQLHETAVEAELRIYELEQQLRAAANRPTIVQRTTVAETGIIAESDSLIGPTFGAGFTTLFNNTSLDSDEQIANNDDVFNTLGEGVYEIGFYCNAIASGAVNAGSYRLVRIQQYTPDPSSTGPLQNGMRQVNQTGYVSFDSNVGNGVDVTIVGEFRIRAGDVIFFTLIHGNAASNMNVSIGALGWLSKVSESTITAVL